MSSLDVGGDMQEGFLSQARFRLTIDFPREPITAPA